MSYYYLEPKKKIAQKTLYKIPWLKRYWTFLIEEEEETSAEKKNTIFKPTMGKFWGLSARYYH